MHAALEINIPNYANAIGTAHEIIDLAPGVKYRSRLKA
jgi:hypothetical protein